MKINPFIFKAYDIRGVYPEDLNEEITEKVAKALVLFLKAKKVAVGCDMRISSPSLKRAVIRGFLRQGVNVYDVGLVSTPTFYFGVGHFGLDGGIMITASHNPKEYNGLKLVRKGSAVIGGNTGMEKVKEIVFKNKFPKVAKKGKLKKIENPLGEQIDEVLKEVNWQKIKAKKIVADSANGLGALYLASLFEKIPGNLVKMNFKIDGTFPSHEPDPLKPENLKWLQARVKKEKADLGIATDGDGDRIFFLDEKGERVPADIITGLIAKELLKKNPGVKIGYDIRTLWRPKEIIKKAGGKPVLTMVGHGLIEPFMRKKGILFSGESSGHYFFKQSFYRENPLLVILTLLKIISREKKPLSEILKPYKKYFHSGEINFKVGDKKAVMKEIEKKFPNGKLIKIDGLTVELKDWWFNLRPSNTEPLIRLNLEAETKNLMEEKKKELTKIIQEK